MIVNTINCKSTTKPKFPLMVDIRVGNIMACNINSIVYQLNLYQQLPLKPTDSYTNREALIPDTIAVSDGAFV